jgi:hypothetical protein
LDRYVTLSGQLRSKKIDDAHRARITKERDEHVQLDKEEYNKTAETCSTKACTITYMIYIRTNPKTNHNT